jgi:hypothetical protein
MEPTVWQEPKRGRMIEMSGSRRWIRIEDDSGKGGLALTLSNSRSSEGNSPAPGCFRRSPERGLIWSQPSVRPIVWQRASLPNKKKLTTPANIAREIFLKEEKNIFPQIYSQYFVNSGLRICGRIMQRRPILAPRAGWILAGRVTGWVRKIAGSGRT